MCPTCAMMAQRFLIKTPHPDDYYFVRVCETCESLIELIKSCDCKPGDRVRICDRHSPYNSQILKVVAVSDYMATLETELQPIRMLKRCLDLVEDKE